MGNIFTTTVRGNSSNHSDQEGQEYIMTGYKAKLFNMDQPSMGDIITATAGKDVYKEKEHDVIMNNNTKKDRRALLKAASDHDPSSFETLYRLGGYGDTQV